jgi:hypothetical protein
MTNKSGLTLFAATMISATILFTPCTSSAAQMVLVATSEFSAQQQQNKNQTKAAPARRSTQSVVRQPNAGRKAAGKPKTTSRVVEKQTVTPKVATPKTKSPAGARRVVTSRETATVTTAHLRRLPARGAGRTYIGGHQYSAWRSGYRFRYRGGWRTFVALSVLGPLTIGSYQYYPYAYISAPAPYCEGLTGDGCQLRWQQVQTVEGDIVDQCVAYCPWQ